MLRVPRLARFCSVAADSLAACAHHQPLSILVFDRVVHEESVVLLLHVRPGQRHARVPLGLGTSFLEETLAKHFLVEPGLAGSVPAISATPVLLATISFALPLRLAALLPVLELVSSAMRASALALALALALAFALALAILGGLLVSPEGVDGA